MASGAISTDTGQVLPMSTAANADAYSTAFEAFRQIVEVTAEVFQQEPRIKPDYDPEFPTDKYVVLIVETRLDRKAILEKEAEWTRRIARVEPKWDAFRLSIKMLK
jgi:hypothetical protein